EGARPIRRQWQGVVARHRDSKRRCIGKFVPSQILCPTFPIVRSRCRIEPGIGAWILRVIEGKIVIVSRVYRIGLIWLVGDRIQAGLVSVGASTRYTVSSLFLQNGRVRQQNIGDDGYRKDT